MTARSMNSSASRLRHPEVFLRMMANDLRGSFRIARRILVANISAQYRQTYLGYLWAFFPALATTLIFVFLRGSNIIGGDDYGVPYPVFVFVGTILWQTFVEAMLNPISLLTQSRVLLSKINFPHDALVLAGMGEVLFNFCIRALLIAGVLLWYGIAPAWTVLLAPVGVIGLIGFGFVIGLLLAPLGMLYQDIGRALALIAQFWFFLTPVVYMPPTEGPAAVAFQLNPVSPLLMATRDWLLLGGTTHLGSFLVVSAVAVALLMLGWLFYKISIPHVIERIGS